MQNASYNYFIVEKYESFRLFLLYILTNSEVSRRPCPGKMGTGPILEFSLIRSRTSVDAKGKNTMAHSLRGPG